MFGNCKFSKLANPPHTLLSKSAIPLVNSRSMSHQKVHFWKAYQQSQKDEQICLRSRFNKKLYKVCLHLKKEAIRTFPMIAMLTRLRLSDRLGSISRTGIGPSESAAMWIITVIGPESKFQILFGPESESVSEVIHHKCRNRNRSRNRKFRNLYFSPHSQNFCLGNVGQRLTLPDAGHQIKFLKISLL